jgi:hypothetical protein
MSKPELCIGGPLDGEFFISHHHMAPLVVAKRTEPPILLFGPQIDRVKFEKVRYNKRIFACGDSEVSFQIEDGLSDYEAILRLTHVYHQEKKRRTEK